MTGAGRRRADARRPTSSWAALAIAAGWLAAAPAAAAEEERVESPRVVVVATPGLRSVAERCRDVLEAAIPVYERHLPYRLPKGERLVLRLYERAEDYEKAVTAAGAPLLARHGCATLDATKETLVVVRPRVEEDYLALVGGLPERTRYTVAHEGVHQLARRAGAPHVELWPDWYAEGMAEWLAGECLGAGGGGAPPVAVEDPRHRVHDALARGRMLSLERVLHASIPAFERMTVFYAHASELYRLLAADGDRLRRLHEEIRDLPAPTAPTATARSLAYATACAAALERVYGPAAALEAAWLRQTHASSPAWFEEGRSCERVGDELVCAGAPGWNALLVSTTPPGAAFRLSFETHVLDLGDRQADVVLGYEQRDDPRFLKIALGPGYATLLAFSDGRWQERLRQNASIPASVVVPGTWVPIRVHVGARRIRVESGTTLLLDVPVPPAYAPLSGGWGLGATDSCCRFRRIEVAR